MTEIDHEQDLSIPGTKVSKCVIVVPPILKLKREFMRKAMN